MGVDGIQKGLGQFHRVDAAVLDLAPQVAGGQIGPGSGHDVPTHAARLAAAPLHGDGSGWRPHGQSGGGR